jgi:hypothetical protein
MKAGNIIKITIAAVMLVTAAGSVQAAKGGNKDKSDPEGGYIDAVYMVDSTSPVIPPVASNSADAKGQIVFYGQMDISEFEGTWDSGSPCFNPGMRDGIIVMYPQSTKNPQKAELIFWYKRELFSGDTIQHLLTMQGEFDEPGNWPPTEADPTTTVTLNYWEFAAENRKAQRQDCAGSSDIPAGPWVVNVERILP